MVQYFQVLPGQVSGHAQIHIQIITAVLWRRPGHLPLKIPDKLIHFHHQGQDIRGLVIPCQKQIETGPAPHGSEVNALFAKGAVIP